MKFMQAYMEDCYKIAPTPVPTAKFREDVLDKSYDNLHMEYYYFCPQYKDYFQTAGAKCYKCVFIMATFLKDRIHTPWQ